MIKRVCDSAVAACVFGHSGFAQGSTATQDRVCKNTHDAEANAAAITIDPFPDDGHVRQNSLIT